MFYVYLLQSESHQDQRYTGYSSDVKQRLRKHNEGASIHTAKYRPWRLVAYFAFEDERKAREFEFISKQVQARRLPTNASGRNVSERSDDGAQELHSG